MPDELRTVLMLVGISVPIGAAVGLLVRFFLPGVTDRWGRLVLQAGWKIYAFGAVMFGIWTAGCMVSNRPYFATLFAAFFLLEVVCLFLYGFKREEPKAQA